MIRVEWRDLLAARWLTVPNLLSLARAILIWPLAWLLAEEARLASQGGDWRVCTWAGAGVMALIVLTDFLDGWVARRFSQKSRVGQYLDPICDKVVILYGILLFWEYRGFPGWMVAFLYFRDFLALFFGVTMFLLRHVQADPSIWGKASVAAIALSGMVYLLQPAIGYDILWAEISVYPVLAVNLVSIAAYSTRYYGVYFLNRPAPVRSSAEADREDTPADYSGDKRR